MLKYTTILLLVILAVSCSKQKTEPISNDSLFSLIKSEKTNITFNNRISENMNNFFGVYNYAYNGGGVAVGDINNDGLPDIYFTGNQVEDHLYINKGNFTFENITKKSGIASKKSWHNGVVMADVNADGLLDIYICKGGWNEPEDLRGNLLYINQGDNTFKEEAEAYGLADKGFSMMATFFDVDNDNDLDMYLINRPKDFFLSYEQYINLKNQNNDNYRDKLYINNNGKFVNSSKEKGIEDNLGYGLGLAVSDINNDGYKDIFVSNDFYEHDYMYINNKGETLKNEVKTRTNHVAFYGMGVDIVDINNDGLEDIIELDMSPENYVRSKTNMATMNVEEYNFYLDQGLHNQYMHNVLLLNQGNGFFSDISQLSGISKTDWSWSCLGSDFDNDGYKDIFVTNGYKRDIWNRDASIKYKEYTQKGVNPNISKDQIIQEIVDFFPSNKLKNYIFKNKRNYKFENTSKKWGIDTPSFSNGAAYADLDNDGDLDLIINNIDDQAFIYKNNSENTSNNYLRIKFKGSKNNSFGLGNKITLFYNDSIQYQEFKTVRGYLSSVEPIAHFGLGKTQQIDSIQILWPDGKEHILNNITINQLLTINYTDAKKAENNTLPVSPILTEVTSEMFEQPFVHKENIYDDFKDQILIPHKLSQNGPCLAVGDINSDGLEDFYVGGAGNQSGQTYIQTVNGKFKVKKQPAFKNDSRHEDVGATFFDADGDNDLDLYVVSGGNEFEIHDPILQDRLYINNGKGQFNKSNNLPELNESGSAVVPLDFDADGDLDLFVGGRLIPKTYPYAPKSFLLENKEGKFTDVTNTIAPELSNIGMVTSAVWSDIDGNQTNELILVGEWMPITIFKLENKIFKNVTNQYGLENTNGWWNKIVASDIDKDGDTDFVVGNLGLNYKFSASKEKPFIVYANDFDQNGTNDIFLAKHYKDREVPIRGKQCTSQQMPRIGEKYKTYQEFAKADISQIIGDVNNKALKYEAKEFASIILKNKSGKLTIEKLPIQAQFSVINGITVEDFNQDGINDILIAGNKFEVEVETTRADASVGLLMLGTKTGTFKSLNYLESGFFAPYNVKDIQKIKLPNSKTAILTAINNNTTKIFSTN
ncbi:VCBS repeat-containing protein [Flavivirga eckloniae]|uniref:ASPIC/UnbV domain-containing protein n=1 Tax=Flavivirga eckloniae TaxID=1803846 RepID=A0A2K9PU40_9FLAO|nr:VCBS repeat-containing protein [Flavivirga eckloniae]AUP80585.1 hypothetical protein C1H87_18455 [Flavivirga eckloniae]